MPCDAQAVGDVLVDRLRERVRLLEHHADALAQLDDVDASGRRCRRRRAGSSPSMRTPSIRSFMRLRQRSSVDLPQPDGPMKAVTWPSRDRHARCRSAPASRRTRATGSSTSSIGGSHRGARPASCRRRRAPSASSRGVRGFVGLDVHGRSCIAALLDSLRRRRRRVACCRSRLRSTIATRLSSHDDQRSAAARWCRPCGLAASTLGLWKPTS